MQKTIFIDPTADETPEQICCHNLTIADKYLNLQFMIASSMGWLKLNPTKNYQDLEMEFRSKNFNTHLLACKPKDIPNTHLGLHKDSDSTKYEYECIFSCRPKEYAIKELLQHWPNYEDNLAKLDKAGSIIANSDNNEIADNKDIKKLNENEKDSIQLISENKKKISVTAVSAENYLNELIDMCEKEYKRKPEEKIVGMAPNGSPIFGLFLGEELVSAIGFVMELNGKNEKVMRLFDLKKLF